MDGVESRTRIKEHQKANHEFFFANGSYRQNDLCLNRYPFPEGKAYINRWYCKISSDNPPTVILLGNSYANHLHPGLSNNYNLRKHTFLSIGSCSPNWVEKEHLSKNTTKNPCSGYRKLDQQRLINGIIEDTTSLKYVFMSGLPDIDFDEHYFLNLKKRIDFIEKNGVKLVIFKPHLRSKKDIKKCFPRPFSTSRWDCEVDYSEYLESMNNFNSYVDRISLTNPNVLFFDPNELFCRNQKCSLIHNRMPLYRDQYQHISEYGSGVLSEIFVEWAKANSPELLM